MKRRFGDVDNEREAQRKFKNCKQSEHQTIAEFEQTLRLFYKLGWPSATKAQKMVTSNVNFRMVFFLLIWHSI